MEETEDPVSKVSSLGTRGTACAQGHRDRAWCLVECGSLTHAFGREQSFTHGVGSPQPSYSTPGPAAEHLNRRIRTRTYGGVGGRERQLSLRPDTSRPYPKGRKASSIATGEGKKAYEDNGKDPAANVLRAKGGRVRANKLTPEQRSEIEPVLPRNGAKTPVYENRCSISSSARK